MAAPWAYAFYHSRLWRDCRTAYAGSVHWLCESCGKPGKIVHHDKVWLTQVNINSADITLGFWNLKMVCEDCHNKAHHRVPVESTRPGFAFDGEGNLIESR